MSEIEYTISAKPTKYRGIEFRSRLEARWAAFFDLCGWDWEYEPIDFDGWFPDFAIFGKKFPIYVEVKPVTEMPIDVCNRIANSIINHNCFDFECLVVGQKPIIESEDWSANVYLGWMYERYVLQEALEVEKKVTPIDFDWHEAAIGQWDGQFPKLGFCSSVYTYEDRISGQYDGGCYGAKILEPTKVQNLWGQAHKKTRFQK